MGTKKVKEEHDVDQRDPHKPIISDKSAALA
jgi:hypothetical protein